MENIKLHWKSETRASVWYCNTNSCCCRCRAQQQQHNNSKNKNYTLKESWPNCRRRRLARRSAVVATSTTTTTTAVVATAQHHLTVSAFKVLYCCAHRALFQAVFNDVDIKKNDESGQINICRLNCRWNSPKYVSLLIL